MWIIRNPAYMWNKTTCHYLWGFQNRLSNLERKVTEKGVGSYRFMHNIPNFENVARWQLPIYCCGDKLKTLAYA